MSESYYQSWFPEKKDARSISIGGVYSANVSTLEKYVDDIKNGLDGISENIGDT